ncbi:hypothetical protein C5167_030764 [Papaver somniferum]|nr:hypothetical protein C5167_030764 [Papaver somniferum]
MAATTNSINHWQSPLPEYSMFNYVSSPPMILTVMVGSIAVTPQESPRDNQQPHCYRDQSSPTAATTFSLGFVLLKHSPKSRTQNPCSSLHRN